MSDLPSDDDTLARFLKEVEALQRERFAALGASELANIARELGVDDVTLQRARAAATEHLERGKGFVRHQLFDEAIAELRRAHALAPGDDAIDLALAEAHAGCWSQDGGNEHRVEAERLARAIVQRRPDNDAAFIVLRTLKKRSRARGWLVFATYGAFALAGISFGLLFVLMRTTPSPSSGEPRATVVALPVSEPPAPEPTAPLRTPPTASSSDPSPPPPTPSAHLDGLTRIALTPSEGAIPVDWYAPDRHQGLTVEVQRSKVEYGYYKIVGRLRVSDGGDLGPLKGTLELLDASDAVIGRTEVEVWQSYQPRMLPGDSTTFDRMIEARLGEPARARLITPTLDREAAATAIGSARVLPIEGADALPDGVKLELRERARTFNASFDKRRFFRVEYDVTNTGQMPIRQLKLGLELSKQGVELLTKTSWVASISAPPLMPGERRAGVFLGQIGDFDAERVLIDGVVK